MQKRKKRDADSRTALSTERETYNEQKKIIARGRKRERQVAADGIAEEERRGGARICQGRHTRAQIYKAGAVLRPRKVPPAAPSPLPRAHTNDRSSRTGRDSTRLDSNRIDPSSFSKNSTRLRSSRNSPRPFANIKVAARFTEGEARPRALVSTR